uniref:Anaphase-promoting complex subunit 4-like WD40 domain-containing protein n=2 Tax=Clastoptera arizonana TaxID=38151 RepID=A0A1B6CBI0_9HEMI
MAPHQVHNIRFYNLEPRAIHCMAYENDLKKLALSRSDNSIEIWNLCYTPHIERTILGEQERTVESIVWCDDRLFSAGLNGMIVEYDLFTLLPKYNIPVTSGPCWCLGINSSKTLIAGGTEDGYINIFQIQDDSLIYEKILDKQEGRILCLAWDSTGEKLVTGSVDAVRIWNVNSGHAIYKMTTGRSMTNKETIVWCVAVTNDFTIISGDSRGKLTFWDGNMGTSIATYQSHEADVLSLCLDDQQTTLYAAGVDPLITTFEKIKLRQNERHKWVKSIQRRIHYHDVRALAYCDGKLFSGGVDGYLCLSSYPPKVLLRYPPIFQKQSVIVAPKVRCVLLCYLNYLEVWRLGETKCNNPTQSQILLPLSKDVVKLIHLESYGKRQIRCASISSDGHWLAYSTDEVFRLYAVNIMKDEPVLERVHLLSKECEVAHCIAFSADSKTLVCLTPSGSLLVINLTIGKELKVLYTLKPFDEKLVTDLIHLLQVSSDGEYIVVADRQSNIIIWKSGEYYSTLPKYKCAPTTMAIDSANGNLLIVYCDHKIVEYDLSKKRYTKFSRQLNENHPKQWLTRSFTVTNITFDPMKKDLIILNDDSTICIINKDKELPNTEAKIPRLDTSHDSSENSNQYPLSRTPQYAFHVIKKYKHLVYFGSLSNNEMLAVEVNPITLSEKLPPSLKQKRFGAM